MFFSRFANAQTEGYLAVAPNTLTSVTLIVSYARNPVSYEWVVVCFLKRPEYWEIISYIIKIMSVSFPRNMVFTRFFCAATIHVLTWTSFHKHRRRVSSPSYGWLLCACLELKFYPGHWCSDSWTWSSLFNTANKNTNTNANTNYD